MLSMLIHGYNITNGRYNIELRENTTGDLTQVKVNPGYFGAG